MATETAQTRMWTTRRMPDQTLEKVEALFAFFTPQQYEIKIAELG